MLYAIGTRIVLKHTGLAGKINDHLDGGMVEVRLDDGDEIPVFLEDIVREDEYLEQNRKSAQLHQIPAPARPPESRTVAPPTGKRYGIQLAFEPEYNQEGQVSYYRIFLLNDTDSDIIFALNFYLKSALKIRTNNKLPAASYLEVGTLPFDQLNDNPEVEVSCWELTTSGSGYQQDKRLKIRAKQFFKKVINAPLFHRPVHHYVLFEKLGQHDKAEEDLKSYTRRNSTSPNLHTGVNPTDLHEVSQLANFSGEIDLHIENLVKDHRKMSNLDILRLQLKHFDQYLDRAHSLGVDRVFVIHGLGKGKLRDSIASRLINDHRIATFRNEYHPKFGYGATEVIFR